MGDFITVLLLSTFSRNENAGAVPLQKEDTTRLEMLEPVLKELAYWYSPKECRITNSTDQETNQCLEIML